MTTITKAMIANEFNQVLDACFGILDESKWRIKPQGLGYTEHKTKYGMATPSGMVLIGTHFVGTTAVNKLKNTIIHELAHLAVGLENNHNRRFKLMEKRFGGSGGVDESDYLEIAGNIKYKYNVIAHLANGVAFDVGGMHRKTKKYSQYMPTDRNFMSIDSVRVERFEYQLND